MPSLTKHLDEIPQISVMWQGAREAVADAESILLFGFSMPLSDHLLAMMIREQVRKHGKLKRVGSIDLNPHRVIENFKTCMPRGLDIEYSEFLVEQGKTPDWFVDNSTIAEEKARHAERAKTRQKKQADQ